MNRRLLDKKIEIEFKKPWDLLYFSDDSLKQPVKITGRSPENIFCEKQEKRKWSPFLYKMRTFFMATI